MTMGQWSKNDLTQSPSVSSIAGVRQAWREAVTVGDAELPAELVTDDVVVVHGNGRCVHGRDDLKTPAMNSYRVRWE